MSISSIISKLKEVVLRNSGPVTPFYVVFLVLSAMGAWWITALIYEPHLTGFQFNNPYVIFLIVFAASYGVSFVTLSIFDIFLDTLKKKSGSFFRMQITSIILTIISVPIVVITIFTTNIFSTNNEILLKDEISSSLMRSVELLRKDYNNRKQSMLLSLRWMDKEMDINDLFEVAQHPGEEIVQLQQRIKDEFGIRNMLIFDENLNYIHSWQLPQFFSYNDFIIKNKQDFGLSNAVYDYKINGIQYIAAVRKIKDRGYIVRIDEISEIFINRRDEIISSLRAYKSLKAMQNDFETIMTVLFIIVSIISAVIAIFLGFLLSRSISTPIDSLIKGTNYLAKDKLDFQLPLSGTSDMRYLIERFNKMVMDLRQHRELLLKNERIEAWREVAVRVAHEVKNPLTPINLNAGLIKRAIKNKPEHFEDKVINSATSIIKQSDSILQLINNFSQFSFKTNLSDEAQSINMVVQEAYESFFIEDDNIAMRLNLSENDMKVRMDKAKLVMAFMNIIKNSRESIEGEGIIQITSRARHDTLGDSFLVSIEDNGCGIEDDKLASIFEPYFTTKKKGSGLGLSLVEKIINEHNGFIYLDSKIGEGTIFFIEFRKTATPPEV